MEQKDRPHVWIVAQAHSPHLLNQHHVRHVKVVQLPIQVAKLVVIHVKLASIHQKVVPEALHV
jgi:hypothetical protein